MSIYFKKTLSIFIICLLFSCKQNKSPFFDEVLKSKQGHLRGVEIGTTLETVKNLENKQFLRDKMANYLHYDYEMSMGNTYTATYDFSSENKLYEIEIAVFLDVVEDAEMLFNNFSDYFNRKYSPGKIEDDRYINWNTLSSGSNNRISISMINDSESYGYITILIRDLDR